MGTKKNTRAHAKRKIRNTVIMEKTNFNSELAYKKAQKRVRDIKTYWCMVLGFFLVGGLLIYRDYDGNIFNLSYSYQVWMVATWAIFLVGFGIFLFLPYFRNWEERKIKKLMNKK